MSRFQEYLEAVRTVIEDEEINEANFLGMKKIGKGGYISLARNPDDIDKLYDDNTKSFSKTKLENFVTKHAKSVVDWINPSRSEEYSIGLGITTLPDKLAKEYANKFVEKLVKILGREVTLKETYIKRMPGAPKSSTNRSLIVLVGIK